MPNALISMLRDRYEAMSAEFDAVANRCAEAGREPTDVEARSLAQIDSEMEPLGERIKDLVEQETRRYAANRVMENAPRVETRSIDDRGRVVNVGTGQVVDEEVDPEAPVRLAPLMASNAQLRRLSAAIQTRSVFREDLEPVQTRAVFTPPGAMVGAWQLPDPMLITNREPRLADLLNSGRAEGNTIQYLAVFAAAQSFITQENVAKQDSGMTIVRRSANMVKLASFTDLTWEMAADFSDAQTLVNAEMMGAITTAENTLVLAELRNGTVTPTLASPSRIVALLELKQAIRNGPSRADADIVILNPLDVVSVLGELTDPTGTLMAGPAVIIDPEGYTRLWGMRLVQSSGMAVGSVVEGVSQDATWWQREGPQLIVDPYSESKRNVVVVISEERGGVGMTRAASWGVASLPPLP
jgi:hypothetical protein